MKAGREWRSGELAELFQTIELKNDSRRGRRLVRAVAGSFLLHLFVVALIFLVPDVRSVLRLSNMFSGVEYGDEAYTKTRIRERAEIINIADMEGGFQYPSGYFSKNAPPPEPTAERLEVVEARPTPTPRPTPAPTPSPTPRPSPTPQASPEVANTGTGANANTNSSAPSSEEETERELNRQAEFFFVKGTT